MLKKARNGDSITPKYDKSLKGHVLNKRLQVLTDSYIENGTWSETSQSWSIQLCPKHTDLPHIDHVIYATGSIANINKVACMESMTREYPIESISGIPKITHDLMWRDDIPLFLTGAMAGLRLGPGAANLAGARLAPERIACKVEELLDNTESASPDLSTGVAVLGERSETPRQSGFSGGFENQFQAPAVE